MVRRFCNVTVAPRRDLRAVIDDIVLLLEQIEGTGRVQHVLRHAAQDLFFTAPELYASFFNRRVLSLLYDAVEMSAEEMTEANNNPLLHQQPRVQIWALVEAVCLDWNNYASLTASATSM